MDDAEYAAQKQRLLDLSDKWIKPLGLGWWDIEFEYARDDYVAPPNASSPDLSLAQCLANWRYGHACITWNMPRVREIKDQELERCFVHELCHVFLSETRETGEDWLDHEERVASTLTKAFLWLRDSLAPVEASDESYPLPDDVVIDPRTQQLISAATAAHN